MSIVENIEDCGVTCDANVLVDHLKESKRETLDSIRKQKSKACGFMGNTALETILERSRGTVHIDTVNSHRNGDSCRPVLEEPQSFND